MPIDEMVSLSAIVAEQSTVISAILEDLLAIARMRGPGLTVSEREVDLLREVKVAVDSLGKR